MKYLCLRAVDKTHGELSTVGVDVNSEQTAVQHHAQVASHPHHHLEARDSGLYLIGLFKLGKAIFFLGVSLGALHFIHHDLGDTVDRIFRELHFDPESRVVDFITDKVALVTHHKLRLISLGSVLYACLCCTEAYGLLRRRTWAEFVTLWLSASFLPWESYEIVRDPNLWHLTIILVNLAVVAYLVWMIQRKKRRKRST